MANAPQFSAEFELIERVFRFYAVLTEAAQPDDGGAEPGLGGKLVYAGCLDDDGRALLVAANIAGAATMAAEADPARQKQAIRDGVADFLVNSLDEALRILKNEVRKRAAVAVCVGLAPAAIEAEMLERGVLPDLLRPEVADDDGDSNQVVVAWSVDRAPAMWLPQLDAVALECLAEDDWQARRWLRLAPRFMGRMAQRTRMVSSSREFAQEFVERVRGRIDLAQIGSVVEIQISAPGMCEHNRFAPRAD